MQSISPLLAWFFTLVLLCLAARAAARLAVARFAARFGSPRHPLTPTERNRELGHAAMAFSMAVLLVPGLPRPPQAVSVCFFAVLAALAVLDWVRRLWARRVWAGRRGQGRGQGRAVAAVASCGPAEGGRLLDPHHAIVGLAMVVMLLRPGGGMGMGGGAGLGSGAAASMPGMGMVGTATETPSATVLLFLGYVWVAALVLGYGMTRALAADQPGPGAPGAGGGGGVVSTGGALLSSPATVYACELAMTVLTGLMLLT